MALARALAAEPDVLLLDEPLAGLDVAAATAMRKVLRRVLARDGRSAVLITHDLLDVLTLADRVLVLEAGRIAESGSTATVLATPRSRFGARFAGVNLVGGTADAEGVLTTQWGTTWHGSPVPDLVAGESAVGCSTRRRSPYTATKRMAALATPSRWRWPNSTAGDP